MIRLTKSGNGEPVYVSPDLIVSAEIVDEVTMLNVRSDRIFVTESPEEVARKVLEWKYIMQKSAYTNTQEMARLRELAGLEEPKDDEG